MEKLTILELIDFIRKNWKYIHTLEESKVEHFFLQRSPIELLLFASQLECASRCKIGSDNSITANSSDESVAVGS
jgi:hypothetical protein